MNLVVDIGNTRSKAAVFEKKELKDRFAVPAGDLSFIAGFIHRYPTINKCILSGSGNVDPAAFRPLLPAIEPLVFSGLTPVPLENTYRTPETLGPDRLAVAVAASYMSYASHSLVIDAGTCITYDLVSNRKYLGGSISPGLHMRFKALHTFTAKLPEVQPDPFFKNLPGRDTNESILSGVQDGLIAETEGMIEKYTGLYPGLSVFLCGGDADFFAGRLKSAIFVEPDLGLIGLNLILDYQHA